MSIQNHIILPLFFPTLFEVPNKEVSWKNRTLTSLSWSEKPAMAITKASRVDASSFWAPTSVFLMAKPSSAAFVRCIASTSLPRLVQHRLGPFEIEPGIECKEHVPESSVPSPSTSLVFRGVAVLRSFLESRH